MTSDIPPPRTETELLQRAATLAGTTLAHLAALLDTSCPEQPKRAKGWIGATVEGYLGASAANRPEPDFHHLGIELKTVPINSNGRPRESTFICRVPLTGLSGLTWENSTVRKKLDRVLWIPVEADPAIPFRQRRIGSPLLWSPDPVQESALRTDWEEFMELICLGKLEEIDSRYGRVMQVRPKAENARSLTRTATAAGETGHTLPRGFYLRTSFTHSIFQSVR